MDSHPHLTNDSEPERSLVRLYHFTCLCYLPSIIRHGIQRGEVPVGVYPRNPNAANLTGYGDRGEQEWFNAGNIFDKTKVRLAVEVPECSLTSFAEVQAKHRLTEAWLTVIDPLNQRDRWFFAFDGVLPEHVVEVGVVTEENSDYRTVSGTELESLICEIEEEQDRVGIVSTSKWTTCDSPRMLEGWLFDGPQAKAIQREIKLRERERSQKSLERRSKKRVRKLKKKQKKSNRRK